MELSQNLWQTFACVASKKILPKKELSQNLWQTFACVASEKKLSPKNGVVTKFMANFCLFSTEKNFLPKMELPQNLWQM